MTSWTHPAMLNIQKQAHDYPHNPVFPPPATANNKPTSGAARTIEPIELHFTFIPAPVYPDCPTAVSLSLKEEYGIVTLYGPEPEDIPDKFQPWNMVDGRDNEHEAQLHQNKQGSAEHYHFKFNNTDNDKVDAFVQHAINNYLLIRESAFDKTYENYLSAKTAFINNTSLNKKSFENQDHAERNKPPSS